jgi:membrane protease YdiL (CAAX protease family)
MTETEPVVPRSAVAESWLTPLLALCVVAATVIYGQLFAQLANAIVTALLPKDALAVEPGARMFAGLLAQAAQLALFFWFVRWLAGPHLLGWLLSAVPRMAAWRWAGFVLLLFAVKVAVTLAFVILAGPDAPTAIDGVQPLAQTMKTSIWPLLIATGIIAAVIEEIIYRGYLSRVLEASRLGVWGGASIASLIWAAQHVYYPFSAQVVLFCLGLTLSWARRQTGSIYPGMLWHAINNVVALLAMRAIL